MMSRVNRNALHSDEVKVVWDIALNFKAQSNRLPNPLHQLIKRLRLGVAAGQRRNGGDKVAVRVLFNDNVKLPSHGVPPRAILRSRSRQAKTEGGPESSGEAEGPRRSASHWRRGRTSS